MLHDPESPAPRRRPIVAVAAFVLLASVTTSLVVPSDQHLARGAAIVSAYLVLALSEIVPPFVPTLSLLAAPC